MKPKIVFFSRAYQEVLFPLLQSDKYDSVHITLTEKEKVNIEAKGFKVDFCFETYTKSVSEVEPSYLLTSFLSDRFLNKNRIDKRISILKKEISFWAEIFDTYKPIAVINEEVAIEIAEVMYIEAHKRGIQYKAWMTNPVNGYFYWVSNPMSLSLDERIFSKTPTNKSIIIAEEYVKKIIEKNERPYYLTPFLNQNKFRNFMSSTLSIVKSKIKAIFTNSNAYEDNKAATANNFERSLKTFFLNYNTMNDFNGYEAVLYPLHYEPEASLAYLSEFFSNQVALIENISKCLSANQVLVVKEHPAQPGMLLTKRYQELYQNSSCLLYLPSSIISYDVIKKADLIVTLTSHLGWEALILGKPVYLLGKMFYDKYPFINKFISFDILRSEIRTKSYLSPNIVSVKTYIAQLLDISYPGMPFPCEELYKEQNIRKIVYAIENELSL